MKKDLYGALMDKTDGDANLLVKSDRGEGLMGYMKVNK